MFLVDSDGFESYDLHFMIPTKFLTSDPELKLKNGKYQENDEFILNNAPRDSKWDKIFDILSKQKLQF